MSATGTEYVPIQGGVVNTLAAIPSDADTTSGYYLSYVVTTEGNGGGFTGNSWCLLEPGNPFTEFNFSAFLSSNEMQGGDKDDWIVTMYNKYGNLNYIFQTWSTRVTAYERSNFCNKLINDSAYHNKDTNTGCIVMAG